MKVNEMSKISTKTPMYLSASIAAVLFALGACSERGAPSADKADPKVDVTAQLTPDQVIEKYKTDDKAWHKIQDKIGPDAKNKEEYDKMMAEQAGPHPDIKPALEASLQIVKADPKSDKAFKSLRMMIEQTRGMAEGAAWVGKALPYLQEYHSDRPEMLSIGYDLYRANNNDIPGYTDFMDTLASKSADANVSANIYFLLARTEYSIQNSPSMTAKQRGEKKASALGYLENIQNNPKFADVEYYNPRGKSRGRPAIPLAKKAANLLFAVQNMSIGATVPNVQHVNLADAKDQIENYRGKVLLIDFWATWCGPCVRSIPHLVDLKKKYDADKFEVLSISVDDEIQDVKDFQEDTDMPWAHWFTGPKHEMVNQWNIAAFPTYILVDKEGVIQLITNGISPTFEKKMDALVKS